MKKIPFMQAVAIFAGGDSADVPSGEGQKKGFEEIRDHVLHEMSVAAAKTFFDQTVGSEVNHERLAKVLQPFIEKGLVKAFNGANGLKNFLVNVGHLPDE